jgi:4-diphosphocytidyl-2-C-methyl-D-erythritol kinase
VGEILNRLEQMPGAVLARLSGSGPTCFALFRAAEEAAAAALTLRSAHPDWWIEATTLA